MAKVPDDNDKSIKLAICEGNYLVCDLTVDSIRNMQDTGDSPADLDELLDECQGNIHSGAAEEQILVIRIRR